MMIRFQHLTRYTYSDPVFLEPHVLRMTPRTGPTQHLVAVDVRITPEPAGLTRYLDEENNAVCEAWFEERHDRLEILVEGAVETMHRNPFDFLLREGALSVPLKATGPHLAPYLADIETGGFSEDVQRYSDDVARLAEQGTIPFLTRLALRINREIRLTPRAAGSPRPPSETLLSREGACRDMAVLYMACCRYQGIPARYVSGYYFDQPDRESYDLHAWVEVFVPGGGWRGFDPAAGLAVTSQHIILASSARPEGATPVFGYYRGGPINAHMQAEIRLGEYSAVPV